MNEQIQYITALAKQYKTYAEQPEELFAAVNQLSETAVKMIYEEYKKNLRSEEKVLIGSFVE